MQNDHCGENRYYDWCIFSHSLCHKQPREHFDDALSISQAGYKLRDVDVEEAVYLNCKRRASTILRNRGVNMTVVTNERCGAPPRANLHTASRSTSSSHVIQGSLSQGDVSKYHDLGMSLVLKYYYPYCSTLPKATSLFRWIEWHVVMSRGHSHAIRHSPVSLSC